jgi:hypothetical protein
VGGLVEGWPLFNGGGTLPITLSVGSNLALSRKTGLYCVFAAARIPSDCAKTVNLLARELDLFGLSVHFSTGFLDTPRKDRWDVNRDTVYLVSASRYGCCEVEGIGFSELGIVTARRITKRLFRQDGRTINWWAYRVHARPSYVALCVFVYRLGLQAF